MVLITKEEKDAILTRFPKVNIVRTMKQRSKRHRYYCEEAPGIVRYLNQLRRVGVANAVRAQNR